MRITKVNLNCSGGGFICEMSFRDPNATKPYIAKAIVGLDADELVPRYYGKSASNKGYYNLSLEKREIVIRIKLNPDFSEGHTYSALRDDIYRKIATTRSGHITVNFFDGDNKVASISGFVMKIEAPHFNKEPEVQLTINCNEDPMLRAPDPVVIDGAGLDPSATLINDPLSTAPHGFKFEMRFIGASSFLKIEDDQSEWFFEVAPDIEGAGFLANDHLFFSSEHNNKYLYVVRSETIHVADKILAGSIWPILFPGNNNFVMSAGGNIEWLEISHYPTYWGV